MADLRYTTVSHPVSGDTYAVEIEHSSGDFTRAAGPLYFKAPRDPWSLKCFINDQENEEGCIADAAWLESALAKEGS